MKLFLLITISGMLRNVFVCLFGIHLCFFVLQAPAQSIEPTFADVDYTGSGQERHRMNIYVPKSVNAKAPAVIYIHGGAWRGGSKEGAMNACDTLYQSGFVVVGINYRLSGDSIFPAQLYDCKAAVRFVKRNAATYRIDTSRIGVIGFSTGGHLAALLGTSQGIDSLEGLHLGSRSNPITYVSGDEPPFAIHHSLSDCIVPATG